jgi:hypothetical protein
MSTRAIRRNAQDASVCRRTRDGQQIQVEPLEPRRLLAAPAGVDVVLEWNQVLIDALRADRTLPGPGFSSRAAAIMHAAVYDAINCVDGRYQSYLVEHKMPSAVPLTAAGAAAGWRVLSAIYPQQQATFDEALEQSLLRVKDGPMETKGIALGVAVADAILARRADDGSDVVVPYTPGTNLGDWQPTPPDLTSAWGPGWGQVTPFSMASGDQFRPPPVPSLTSDEYTAAYEEVKLLGEKDSAARTAEQTEIGHFWAYDRAGTGTPPALYNQMLQVIARQQHNSMVDNARLFALANLAMADAGIAAWDCKFIDNFWRPVTAIQQGDFDGNPLTEGDPDWQPLGAPGGGGVDDFTPPFPAYVSGHATFGAAVCRVLASFYGRDDIPFTLASDELPGVTRAFDSFSDAAAENGISRIFLGIHWSFDNTAGQQLGRDVADFVFATELTPRKAGHDSHHGSHALLIDFEPAPQPGLSIMTLLTERADDLLD